MNMPKINRQSWGILASACTALLVSGCGGGVEAVGTAQEAALQPVLYSGGAATAMGSSTSAHADTESFTLQPATEFKGFNPEVWNDNKAWYECDCGKHSQPQPRKMEWNPI
ncbi:MAG TPA: hypothetical protein DHV59_15690 [Oxalobacteraceae bacterium]|nr:hypothetical protein [Oxalobacteraceae bacterium]